jgi:hypothetical protein
VARFAKLPLFSPDKDLALVRGALDSLADHARRDPKLAKRLIKLSKSPDFTRKLIRETSRQAVAASAESAPRLYRALKAERARMLGQQHETLKGFERRLYKTWRQPLDLLELMILTCAEAAETISSQWPWDKDPDRSLVFDVVRRLQARACLVASEIHTLLRTGYAPAAHARWRSLHELAATALLITQRDRPSKELAERFLLHEHVDAWKAAQQYQKYSRRLHQRRFSQREMARFKQGFEAVLAKYGKDFKNQYGWAAAALNNPNPTFADIEVAAQLDHMRPYYKMASYPVHATAKTIRFSLALAGREDILITGPSNYGLTDPGHSTAISLGQATTPLITLWPTLDTIVLGRLITLFSDEIGKAFAAAQRRLDAKISRQRSRDKHAL